MKDGCMYEKAALEWTYRFPHWRDLVPLQGLSLTLTERWDDARWTACLRGAARTWQIFGCCNWGAGEHCRARRRAWRRGQRGSDF